MFPGNDFQNHKYLSYLIIRKFPAFRADISFWFPSGMNSQAAFVDQTNLKPETQTLRKKMPDNSLLVNSQQHFLSSSYFLSGVCHNKSYYFKKERQCLYLYSPKPSTLRLMYPSQCGGTDPPSAKEGAQSRGREVTKRSYQLEYCIKARLVPQTSSAATAPQLKSHIST